MRYRYLVMPLSELAGLAATLDEHGRSAVADAVAARWGVPAGTAQFHRSSASHVFKVAVDDDTAYLKFVPATLRPRRELAAIANLMQRLSQRGPGVAAPLSSVDGQLLEAVETPRGHVHAMLISEAPGESIDPRDLSRAQAENWGAALARLHRDSEELVSDDLPTGFADLTHAETTLSADEPLTEAVARLRASLERVPRDGAIHGDFELDNLAWLGNTPTAFDFDDAARSWYVADIASALRDPASPVAEFLAGYRSVRQLTDADLAHVPLFTAAQAACWLIRLPTIVDRDPSPDDPPWLTTLRTKLYEHGRRQRSIVLEASPPRQ